MIIEWTQNVPFNDSRYLILTSRTDIREMLDHNHDHDHTEHDHSDHDHEKDQTHSHLLDVQSCLLTTVH